MQFTCFSPNYILMNERDFIKAGSYFDMEKGVFAWKGGSVLVYTLLTSAREIC